MNVIELESVDKRYGPTVAVEDLSFSVSRGEIFGVVGPNGAGKTTAVEIISGLRRADSGRIETLGVDPIIGGSRLRNKIGIQLQHAALQDRLKVWEAMDLYASFYDQPADVNLLIDQWGLREKRNASFSSLSGGQKQRLFIALALVNQPELVIFDELTTGLDPQSRRSTWELVRSVRDSGATVLLVTHFMEEAERLCDRVLVIDGGRSVAIGSPSNLVSRHAPGSVVRFKAVPDLSTGWIESLVGVDYVVRDGSDVVVGGEGQLLSRVALALAEHGISPPDLRAESNSLEDVFVNLTGNAIKD